MKKKTKAAIIALIVGGAFAACRIIQAKSRIYRW